MKKTLLLAALGIIPHFAQAQILELDLEINRRFILTNPTSSQYVFGTTELYMLDGQVYLAPCVFDPSPVIIPPTLGCTKGTTGFIIQGDVNGDGIADDRSFWSVDSITTHQLIESFYPTGITLVAAPPSKLARPSGDFRDGSVATFYNVLTEVIKRYDVAYYTYYRSYDGILLTDSYQRHAEQWVPGVYIYNVPLKGQINKFLPLRLTVTSMVEANGFRKGLKGFGLKTSMWSAGALDVDARLVSDLVWEGNTRNNTVSTDIIEFSMSDDLGNIVYPVPDTPYRLDSPFLTKLTMIPYVFNKGDVGTSTMKFSRRLQTSTVSTDTSSRSWTWPTRFIDSYKGHDLYEFRIANDAAVPGIKIAGNAAKLRAPTADFDGDGLSNVMEFAFTQDDGDDLNTSLEWTSYHNDPLLQPTPVQLFSYGLTAPITAPPTYLDTLAAGVPNVALVTNKRANVGGGITYGYEVNYNTADPKSRWTKLSAPKPGETVIVKDKKAATISGNPNFTWTIIDTIENPPIIGTTSIQASNALPATVRVRATAAVNKGY